MQRTLLFTMGTALGCQTKSIACRTRFSLFSCLCFHLLLRGTGSRLDRSLRHLSLAMHLKRLVGDRFLNGANAPALPSNFEREANASDRAKHGTERFAFAALCRSWGKPPPSTVSLSGEPRQRTVSQDRAASLRLIVIPPKPKFYVFLPVSAIIPYGWLRNKTMK